MTKGNLRCSRFLRPCRNLVLSVAKKIELEIPKGGLATNKRKLKSKPVDTQKINIGMEIEESWEKRKKQKHSYFKRLQLKNTQLSTEKQTSAYEDCLLTQICIHSPSVLVDHPSDDTRISTAPSPVPSPVPRSIPRLQLQFFNNGLVSSTEYYIPTVFLTLLLTTPRFVDIKVYTQQILKRSQRRLVVPLPDGFQIL